MSIEKALTTLAVSMDRLAEANSELASAMLSGNAPSVAAPTTTASKKSTKPETPSAKKKRLAKEKAEKEAAEAEAGNEMEDLEAFKAKLLGMVAGRKDAVPFTLAFLKDSGFQSAAEVPEEQWPQVVSDFETHIAAETPAAL